MTVGGKSAPMSAIISSLVNISFPLLACPVERLPSCPVFIACSMSTTSSPLTSPTIILSGRILRLAFSKSLIVMALFPSIFSCLASNLTRFGSPLSLNSAESSIVITLSPGEINSDKALSNVVFPEPVPPLIKILFLVTMASIKYSAASLLSVPDFTKSSKLIPCFKNFLMVIIGPLIATGSKITFTLEPSSSLASNIGFLTSTTLFTLDAIL